jgi:hypothetical protein
MKVSACSRSATCCFSRYLHTAVRQQGWGLKANALHTKSQIQIEVFNALNNSSLEPRCSTAAQPHVTY